MRMRSSDVTATDQFCGFGGSSVGATRSGVRVVMAMNHWKLAVEVHNSNFPNTAHDCTDISAVDPRRYPTTDILITSPECTNHSISSGKQRHLYKQDLFGNILIDPASERSRATMWDVPRFAEYHDYRVIIVENVVDAKKWRLWEPWLHAMQALNYEHEVVYFNSMFAWPTPQSRDRMYVVFWKRGNRKPDLNFTPLAYCPRCGKNVESRQFWKKAVSWGRYGIQYFYVCPLHPPENRRRNQTLESWQSEWSITPYYYAAFNAIDFSIKAERIGDRKKPLKPKTMERVRYGFEIYGRKPLIVTNRYTSGVECRVRDALNEPIPTQPGDASHAVVLPWLTETSYSGNNRVRSSIDPIQTQTTEQTIGLVGFLSRQYGGQADPKNLSKGLDAPTGTITTWDHHALIGVPTPFMVKTVRQNNPFAGISSCSDPMPTQTTCEDVGIIQPSFIAEMHGTSKAAGIDEPLMCLTAGGGHHALISADAFLTYYYGNHQASGMTDPIGTVTSIDRISLVSALESMTVDDLTFRMLRPHEIGKAMAFPGDYNVLGTNREQVKGYGNAVTPPVMEMIVERCVESLA